MDNMIGLEVNEAKRRLESQGFEVRIIEYASRRGVDNADSSRVLRQREISDKIVELSVSHFKTQMNDD